MKLLTLFSLLLSLASFAADTYEVEALAVVRDAEFKPRTRRVELTDLLTPDAVDGEFFKVVKGKSEEAVRFDDEDEKLVLRAATTYYHLTKARAWFLRELKSEYVRNLPKLTVRVELTNQFNELGHFANDALEPQFNNALTIPGGTGIPGRGITPWGMEIWFRPMKKVHISELKIKNDGMGDWGTVLTAFRKQMHMSTLQRFLGQLIQTQTSNSALMVEDVLGWENLLRLAGTSIFLEVAYQYSDPLARAFSRKWFWLDSALVPEIIYHEYAHVALSDFLVLSHSSPVIEGMADFFAGQIADSPNLATKIKDYNTFNGKKATRKQQYSVQFETTDWANSDFVFGMLWDLEAILGAETSPTFVYSLREKLNTSSSVRGQLIEGVLKTCQEKCANPFVDKLKILRRYNSRGI